MSFRFNFNSVFDYEHTQNYLDAMYLKGMHLKKISNYAYSFEKQEPSAQMHVIRFTNLSKGDTSDQGDGSIASYESKGWVWAADFMLKTKRVIVFKADTHLNLDTHMTQTEKQDHLNHLWKRLTSPLFVLLTLFMFMIFVFNLLMINKVNFNLDYALNLLITLMITLNGLNRLRLYLKYKNKLA